jgi:hypothetical protein
MVDCSTKMNEVVKRLLDAVRVREIDAIEEPMICMTRLKKMIGVMIGNVMLTNRLMRPTPSIREDSQYSAGTCRSG